MTERVLERPAPTGRGHAWRQLIAERFQLVPLTILGFAQVLSAQLVVSSRVDGRGLVVGAVGVVALLSLLRLMDEVKDVHKDRLAHPERPLARGLLPVSEARTVIRWWLGILVLAAIGLAWMHETIVGVLYGVCLGLAALMYREFFVSELLEEHPDLNGAVHQVIVLPIYAFATAAAFPDQALRAPVLWFGLAGLGASFTFEVARKLDPRAPEVLRTYLVVHGRNRTVGLMVLSLGLLIAAAWRLDLAYLVGPVAALMLLSLPVLYRRPERFRVLEAMAGVVVLVQILAPALDRLMEVWR